MLDCDGVQLQVNDIVVRRVGDHYRFGRCVLVGFIDASKRQPLAVSVDFDARSATSNSWVTTLEAADLQRISGGRALSELTDLLRRVPDLGSAVSAAQVGELALLLRQTA